MSGTAFSQSLTGDGTSASPYKIYTYTQLDSVQKHLSSHFRLMADIDASSSETANSGAGFVPIGSTSAYFKGYFHGGGHVINNLHINRSSTSGVALFGAIYYNSVVDSLGVTNATIVGNSKTSVVVAVNFWGTVKDCYATGSVTGGGDMIAGLVADNESATITGCHFIGSVKATGASAKYIGGLVGADYGLEDYGKIENSYAKGSVTGYKIVGGLAGIHSTSKVENCFFSGKITGSYTYIGGLIGESIYGKIYNSYAMGSVKGGQYTGGLIGWSSTDTISYCYTTNAVTSTKDNIGGLIGYTNNKSIISYSYTTGSITSTASSAAGLVGTNVSIVKNCYSTADVIGNIDAGGLNGYNSGKSYHSYATGLVKGQKLVSGGLVSYNITSSGCYWNKSTSGQSSGYAYKSTTNITDITGLTTAEMKKSANLDSLDFNKVWRIREDSTYPGLRGVSDNAPFAFPDVIPVSASVLTTGIPDKSLLANDFDIETLQEHLLLQIDSIQGGTYDSGTKKIYYPSDVTTGSVITVRYRVGEKRSMENDTLWGNTARSVFALVDLSDIRDTTEENTPIVIDLSTVAMIYSGALTYSVYKLPVNGTLEINDARLTYTPGKNFYGTDSLSFIVTNSICTDTVWVKITVTPGNTAPVITSVAPVSATENTEYVYTVTATDANGDDLTYSLSNAPDGMTISGNVITWTPGSDLTSSGEVILTVSDGVLTDTETFSITVIRIVKITLAELQKPASGCENGSINLAYTILTGSPSEYRITFSDAALDAGMSNIEYTELTTNDDSGAIEFSIPDGMTEGTYNAILQMRNSSTTSDEYAFKFTVNLSSDYLIKKYDDVILVDNSSNRFTAYQWYKNNIIISGATKQYYNDPDGLSGSYYAKVITTGNESMQTCPLTIIRDDASAITMLIFPNPVKSSAEFTVKINGATNEELQGSVLTLYDSQGIIVYTSTNVDTTNKLTVNSTTGIHEIQLMTVSGKKITSKAMILK